MTDTSNKSDLKINEFIEKAKSNSLNNKIIKIDLIEKMIDVFDKNYKSIEYTKIIPNCLEIALNFYKNLNQDYYNMIVKGIEEKSIIIDSNIKSYVDTDNKNAYIKLGGNDSDLFILVHEFAHFIDRNSIPIIVPNNLNFLAEVFSFYMEKKLELWLNKKEYDDLIATRRNNRRFYESKMLMAIKTELYYEKLIIKNRKLEKEDIFIEDVNLIMKYDVLDYDFVNYLLRYPLANILSDYLIASCFDLNKENICEKCLKTDLYFILESWQKNYKFKN